MIDNKSKTRIINFIRLSFRYSTQRKEILELSIHTTIKGPKGGKRYACAYCNQACSATEIQVDHIDSVVPNGMMQKDMTIDEYVNRLYCDVSNLQVLCKDCHKEKTNSERKRRGENKCGNKINS